MLNMQRAQILHFDPNQKPVFCGLPICVFVGQRQKIPCHWAHSHAGIITRQHFLFSVMREVLPQCWEPRYLIASLLWEDVTQKLFNVVQPWANPKISRFSRPLSFLTGTICRLKYEAVIPLNNMQQLHCVLYIQYTLPDIS